MLTPVYTDDLLWRNFLSPKCRNCVNLPKPRSCLGSKAATIDYFSSRLFRRLVDEILHNIYSGLSLALKGPQ